jgi:predicted amidohydrolase
MVIFQPKQGRLTYSKQMLHSDELPYFTKGNHQVILSIDNKSIVPAICYESLQDAHSQKVCTRGVEVYLASVAKSANGLAKAYKHYPQIARKYSMAVVMSNSVGFCDDFESVGNSAVWNKKGELVGHLNQTKEGILIYNTDNEETIKWTE